MSEARNVVDQYPMENMVAGTPQTTVYRSKDAASGRPVAVKIISSLGSGLKQLVRQHFLRAMGAVQFLQLPAFPEILDFGFTDDDAGFMVMEWIDGFPIDRLAGENPSRILPLLLEVTGALEALAMGQVHHLNLSPDNIFVQEIEGVEKARILGFGTAIYLTGSQSGAMMGHSPESDSYMAPERLDPATASGADGNLADLYSLALMITELFKADIRFLPSGDRIVTLSSQPIARAQRKILEDTLSQALRMEPSRRNISYPLLKKALEDCLEHPRKGREKTLVMPPTSDSPTPVETEDEDDLNYETQFFPEGGLMTEGAPAEPGEELELDLPDENTPTIPMPSLGEEKTVRLRIPDFETPDVPLSEMPTGPLEKMPGSIRDQAMAGVTEETPGKEMDEGSRFPPEDRSVSDSDGPVAADRWDETDPGSFVGVSEAPGFGEEELDETDPEAFDPNQTNPSIDPEKILASASSPDDEVPPPLPEERPDREEFRSEPPEIPLRSSPEEEFPGGDPPPISGQIPPPLPQAPVPGLSTPGEKTPPGEAAEVKENKEKPRVTGSRPKYLAVILPAVVLLILGMLGFLGMRACKNRTKPRPKPIESPTPRSFPTPVPTSPPREMDEDAAMHPILQDAGLLLEEGKIEEARSLLKELSPEEIEAFSEEERRNYDAIYQAVQGSRLEAAISDLEGGLEHGSIRMLKRAVGAFGHLDRSEYADQRNIVSKLKKARGILDLHSRLWKVHDGGSEAEILELSARMIEALPKYSTPYKFRDEAAARLEQASQTALGQRNFKLARSILGPINDFYPERKGLNDMLAEIDALQGLCLRQKKILGEARAAGAAGRPEEGMKLLEGISFDTSLAAEAAELKAGLERQFEAMDKNPPVVSQVPGQKLNFKKKKSIILKFKITDDLKVEKADILLRFAGRRDYLRKNLEMDSRGDYSIKITPTDHKNEDFRFYVEARDKGGHVGRLGSAQKPIEVKRLKGLKAIFGSK